jgi:hypothetical protein
MNSQPYVDTKGIAYRFGEFYPAELSYFGYNESMANTQFPLTQGEAKESGLNWREKFQFTKGKETIKAEDIPDSIADVEDSILNEVLGCVECSRNYRIVRSELEFYRRMNIPIPRRCFYCRHKARMEFKNPLQVWLRSCGCTGKKSENGTYSNETSHFHGEGKCPNKFETTYAPNRPEAVYCEQCYQAEVI